MKKLIFTLTILSVFNVTSLPAFCISPINKSVFIDGGKKNEIRIGSNRATGDMLLRFNAAKAGDASITILNESGKIVLQQTHQLIKHINTIPLQNAIGLSEGSYTIQLVANNKTYSAGFIIWK